MTLAYFDSDTGATVLPDVGRLNYNGVIFSPLYKSKLTANQVLDNAKRIVKWVEWTLEVEGIVALPTGAQDTDSAWLFLRERLQQQGALLIYEGKGFGGFNVGGSGGPLGVPVPGANLADVNWGPTPKVLYFQPLGGALSSMIRWQVTVCIADGIDLPYGPLLQFNFESTIAYDDLGYSSISVRGTMQIPSMRGPSPVGVAGPNNITRSLFQTADDFRQQFLNLQFDLNNFRVTRRNFNYSRDKTSCEFEFLAEELPRMGLPKGATGARGSFSVRPGHVGKSSSQGRALAGVVWECHLRCSYNIRKDFDQIASLQAFYRLLWFRMQCSRNGVFIRQKDRQGIQARGILGTLIQDAIDAFKPAAAGATIMTGFAIDEGLYLDGKTTSFEASWIVLCSFQSLLIATGIWNRTAGPWSPPAGFQVSGGDLWRASVRDIMGWRSWMSNRIRPDSDLIIDLGAINPVVPIPPGGV